jgi:glutamate N-acetyltransferase/amino-acid N-acetyltransferase
VSVTAAQGFVASGVHCGIRRSRLDLALVRSTEPATGAGMFTRNRMLAAPVVVSQEHLGLAQPQAVVVNSGNANAATGVRGEQDARATAATAAELLRLRPEEVLVLSTGVIGEPLPIAKLLAGLPFAVEALSGNGAPAAEAILTTDTRTKQAVARSDGFVVGGIAKGSGMIHPNLATMLAVVTTDYALEPGEAEAFLGPAVERSFNSISVDGECSTNDAVLLLANGAANAPRNERALEEALEAVCEQLSAQVVADGEGATIVAAIDVTGALSVDEAKAIAARIATSPLVKTALNGRDANWGRVLAAAGSAPFNGGYAHLDPSLVTLDFDGVRVIERGAPQGVEPELAGDTVTIGLDLGLGSGHATYLTSDLSSDYVRINADYRS